MAIHKRDRNFTKIMDEVDVESIPIHFVGFITLTLSDGNKIKFNRDEINKVSSIEEFLITSGVAGDIVDMHIELDYDHIEQDVTAQVNQLLNKNESDD